jgi:hypothetical protein
MPINIYWITVVEVRWYTLDGTCLPLFIQPVFFLFWLCLGNFALRRWRPAWALRQGELLTIYTLLALSCVFASHDLLQNLFGVMAHPFRFASPENRWAETFLPFVRRWLFVADKDAVDAFYNGNASPYDPRLLLPWLVPLAWWGLFVLALVVIALAGNILIRRQWTESERLSFPLVQLPLAMTAPGGQRPFWTNRVMWMGFATAATVTFGNGLHWLYPSMPYAEFVKQYDIAQSWNARPWSAVGRTPISMYPFAIGLAYFIPLDLSFSCWFFYVWRKGQQVLGDAMGWNSSANLGWPYFREQSSGAWIGLVVLILIANAPYLARVARAVAGAPLRVTPEERQRYRWAAAALAAGLAFMTLFIMAMGASFGIAAAVTGIYLGLSLAITRVRAELGTPHEINFVSPIGILVSTMGTEALGRANLIALSELHWFNRGYRSHPMPNQLEAMKMAEGGRMELNRLIALMLVASVAAILITYWANLDVTYATGAGAKAQGFKSWVGRESFNRLATWLQSPVRVEPKSLWFTAGGFAFTLVLKGMRGAFTGWPFHPAGYALAMSFAMDYFWFAFFVSWLIKLALVRYGGMRLHTAAAPFFLGLILGDYVSGSVWAIYGPAIGITTYKIFI